LDVLQRMLARSYVDAYARGCGAISFHCGINSRPGKVNVLIPILKMGRRKIGAVLGNVTYTFSYLTKASFF
jgi:hypothetical protein